MYKHIADSIKESSDRMFISSEEKTKFNNYENTMRRKDDSYSKEEVDNKVNQIKNKLYESVECSHSSIDNTLDGYLKDVEILGNTVQDANNLADIRSVGDKVEGQELYEIPVLSYGKNLLSSDLLEGEYINNYRIGANGSPYSINDFKMLQTFKEIPKNWVGKELILGFVGCVAFYSNNSDSSLVSRGFQGSSFTIPQNAKYFRLDYQIYAEGKLQLEEGKVATPYEPYQEDKLTILSPVQLEKVGDVADRIVCKDGVWGVEKNVGTVVFDGTIVHGNVSSNFPSDNSSMFYIVHGDVVNDSVIICDKFPNKDIASASNRNIEGVFVSVNGSNNAFYFRIFNDKLSTQNVAGFKQWLSENNVTIKYKTVNPQFIPLPHSQQVKLRTFANKTNISFLTEIEGTVKAQVPKSLGATVNTHTEQINNLNKELDRVKKLEESTVSTVETESDFTTVEATNGGYFEDVKLEGKTLVNLALPGINPIYFNINMFKTPCEYTVAITFDSDKSCTLWVEQVETWKYVYHNDSVQQGGNYVVFKFNSTDFDLTKSFALSNRVSGVYDSTVVYSNIKMVILEGDHTQNPPSYFEGLKSAGDTTDEIVVSSVNENLLNLVDLGISNIGQFVTVEHIDANNIKLNTLSTNTYLYASVSFDTFKFIPNVRYRIKAKYTHSDSTNAPFISVRKHGDNGKALKDMSGKNGIIENTFVPTHTKHRIDFFTGNHKGTLGGTWVEFTDIQISIDNDDFSYFTQNQSDKKRLLYYNEETQTWEKPILRQWDSIEKHADGKYYYHQRSGEVVLNGSEAWGANGTDDTKLSRQFILANYPSDIAETKDHTTPQLISDTIPATSADAIGSGTLANEVFGIAVRIKGNKGVFITLPKSKLSTQDIEGFKQWLQANNVTVVYQLAQEKVYECTNIDLITYNGETNYIVESGAIVPRTTLKVHNNISNVVNLLQEKVSLLESNQSEYQISQNRILLNSKYTADRGEFRIDIINETYSIKTIDDIDLDTFYLTKAVIDSGKENYDRCVMEEIIDFYTMIGKFSFEMADELFDLLYADESYIEE